MNRYSSRKFIVAVLSLGAAQWALMESLITGSDWRVVVIAIVGLYAGANVAQKAVEGKQ